MKIYFSGIVKKDYSLHGSPASLAEQAEQREELVQLKFKAILADLIEYV